MQVSDFAGFDEIHLVTNGILARSTRGKMQARVRVSGSIFSARITEGKRVIFQRDRFSCHSPQNDLKKFRKVCEGHGLL